MVVYQGKGVYGAVAVGKVSVFSRSSADVRRVTVDDAEKELARVEAAKEMAVGQLEEIHSKALKEVGEANAEIF